MKTLNTLILTLALLTGCAATNELFVPDAGKLAIKYAALKYGAKNPTGIAEKLARFDELIARVDSGEEISAAAFREGVLEAVKFATLDPADQLLVSETMGLVERALDEKLREGSLPLGKLIKARNALQLFRDTLSIASQ